MRRTETRTGSRRAPTPSASPHAATATAIAASTAVDVAVCVLALAVVAVLARATGPLGGALVAVVAAAGGCSWWWARAALGTSVGHRILGLRTVDGATGMPARPLRSGRTTVDVRRGHDPLRLVPRTVELAAASTEGLALPAVAGLALVLDDGSRHVVRQRTVVGRDPAPTAVPGVEARIAIPDLSRTIARAHLVLEVAADADAVVVTDLGDDAGTWVVAADGSERRLPPSAPARLPFGTELRLGIRTLALRRRTDVAAVS